MTDPNEPTDRTTTPADVRRAKARLTLASRHLSDLARDAVSSPSALVRAEAAKQLAAATHALTEAAVRLGQVMGPQGAQVRR